MPDEIDRINETAEDRATGRDFTATAYAESQLPERVREILASAALKAARRQLEAHQVALRTGVGVLGRLTHAPGRVGASFELTRDVPAGRIAWKADAKTGFEGVWPS